MVIFVVFAIWQKKKVKIFKVKQDLRFVVCGYFYHKLDTYIDLEVKTKQFYIQNSGHGSASKLTTRGRVSRYLIRKTKANNLINKYKVIKQKYHKYNQTYFFRIWFQDQFWDICLLIFIWGIYMLIFKRGYLKIDLEIFFWKLSLVKGLLMPYLWYFCLMTSNWYIKLFVFVFLIRYHYDVFLRKMNKCVLLSIIRHAPLWPTLTRCHGQSF